MIEQTIGTVQAIPVPWPAVAALFITLLANTGALFFFGGQVKQALKHHESELERHHERITKLEDGSLERRQRPRG